MDRDGEVALRCARCLEEDVTPAEYAHGHTFHRTEVWDGRSNRPRFVLLCAQCHTAWRSAIVKWWEKGAGYKEQCMDPKQSLTKDMVLRCCMCERDSPVSDQGKPCRWCAASPEMLVAGDPDPAEKQWFCGGCGSKVDMPDESGACGPCPVCQPDRKRGCDGHGP